MPPLPDLITRTDANGVEWSVLSEYVKDATAHPRPQRSLRVEQWHHIDSWLVRPTQYKAMLTFLNTRSLVPTWMPEARNPYYIYLGEHPDSPTSRDLDDLEAPDGEPLSYTD